MFKQSFCDDSEPKNITNPCLPRFAPEGVGVGVLPYMGYIGICGPKRYGFSAVLVIDRVSILANFGHFGHKWGMVFAL